jgi:hypothetical protein
MKFFLLLLWLGLPRMALALVPLEPLQIAEQFVAPAGWAGMKDYLSGEAARQAKRQTLGQQIPPRLQRVCELLQQGPAAAVVAVELRDSVSRSDIYLHFGKDGGGWKLQAVRSLAMTRFGATMLDLLTAMPPAEVAEYNRKHPEADHAFTLGNLKLWTAADADLAAYFDRHRAEFEQARRLVQAGRYFATPDEGHRAGEQAANADPAIGALLQKLFISHVGQRDTHCDTCLEFLIGGLVDNTVGLFYEPNAGAVPTMHPGQIIAIRPLGGGWYLYKTT